MRPHQCRIEGNDHVPRSAGNAPTHTSQNVYNSQPDCATLHPSTRSPSRSPKTHSRVLHPEPQAAPEGWLSSARSLHAELCTVPGRGSLDCLNMPPPHTQWGSHGRTLGLMGPRSGPCCSALFTSPSAGTGLPCTTGGDVGTLHVNRPATLPGVFPKAPTPDSVRGNGTKPLLATLPKAAGVAPGGISSPCTRTAAPVPPVGRLFSAWGALAHCPLLCQTPGP
ncbi:unnamed protein product [Caretta caretta]